MSFDYRIRLTNGMRNALLAMGFDPTTAVTELGTEDDTASATGTAFAQINELQESVNTADTGLLDRATALETAVGTYSGGADLATDVSTLQTEVETADTGLLDRTTALETSVDTADTGLLDRTTALETSVDTADTGLLDRTTALETSVDTADTGLLDRTTALETSVDTADTGLLDRTTALETSVDTADTGLLDRTTALETSVDTADTGLLDRTTALETSVDTADTGLLDRTTALEEAVGTYSGEDDLATDVAALQEDVGDLQHVSYLDYSEDTGASYTYTYDSTPSEDTVVAIPSEKSYAVITPGGATAWALTFTLPAAPAGEVADVRIFKVSYNLGTHTGTVTVGGVVVTGTGILHFFWTGSAWATWSTGAISLTIPDKSTGISVRLEDAGNGNTVTVALPTDATNVGKVVLIAVHNTANSGTACLLNISGNLTTNTGVVTLLEDVANGVYTVYCIRPGFWVSTWPSGIAVNS